MAKQGVISGLFATLAASSGLAHDLTYPPDLLEEATRCAAFWQADHNVQEARQSEEDIDGYSQDISQIFYLAALDLSENGSQLIDYQIELETQLFIDLLKGMDDPETAVDAEALSTRQQQRCNGVGLALGPKWGLH